MSFAHFLIQVFALLLLSFKSSPHISDTSPWLDLWPTYVPVRSLSLLFVLFCFEQFTFE